jgi:hypothetical protein
LAFLIGPSQQKNSKIKTCKWNESSKTFSLCLAFLIGSSQQKFKNSKIKTLDTTKIELVSPFGT